MTQQEFQVAMAQLAVERAEEVYRHAQASHQRAARAGNSVSPQELADFALKFVLANVDLGIETLKLEFAQHVSEGK